MRSLAAFHRNKSSWSLCPSGCYMIFLLYDVSIQSDLVVDFVPSELMLIESSYSSSSSEILQKETKCKQFKMSSNQLIVVAMVSSFLLNNYYISLNEALAQDNNQAEQQQPRDQEQPSSNGDSWQHWWSYDGISGPEYWSINNNWKLCELGMRQSPINIELDKLLYDPNLDPIEVSIDRPKVSTTASNNNNNNNKQLQSGTNAKVSGHLMNNGRGIEFFIDDPSDSNIVKSNLLNGNVHGPASSSIGDTAKLSNGADQLNQLYLFEGPLAYKYKLYKLELHVSTVNSILDRSASLVDISPQIAPPASTIYNHKSSCEHTISGGNFDTFVGELQLHFYNAQLYSSYDESVNKPNAFAAISVFLMMDNVDWSANKQTLANNVTDRNYHALEFIYDNVKNISNKGSFVRVAVNGADLLELITTKDEYVTYDGSLNRPPCSENIKWIILNKALHIRQADYNEMFNHILDGIDNIRPTKALNKRPLRTSINFNQQHQQQRNCHHPSNSNNKNCRDNLENEVKRTEKEFTKTASKKIDNFDKNNQISASMFCQSKPRFTYQINEALKQLKLYPSS